jgi:hypothetical protein
MSQNERKNPVQASRGRVNTRGDRWTAGGDAMQLNRVRQRVGTIAGDVTSNASASSVRLDTVIMHVARSCLSPT